jgi:phosphoribosylaminoimidazole-succinocarboxamide synthase
MSRYIERKASSKNIWNSLNQKGEVSGTFFEFSDRVSVFDIGEIPLPFVGLGELRCAIAGKLFKALKSAGYSTHYISHDTETAWMRVLPVNIPALNVDYGDVATYKLMPVELLCRLVLTEKFISRIKNGEIDRQIIERLLPSSEFAAGVRLQHPFVESSTKFEEADRYISDAEASELVGIETQQLLEHYETVKGIFRFLRTFFLSNGGFDLIDGKLEAALNDEMHMMLVDSISPDELRLIGPDGRSYDKDPVRIWYQETFPDWYQSLLSAKKAYPSDKSMWPTYPGVPPQPVINDVVDRYRQVAEAIRAI